MPVAATDEESTLLVWNKPEGSSERVVDFRVYLGNELIGTSSQNAREHTPAQEYVEAFYQRDEDGFHTKTLTHSFKVTGLEPSTTYRFSVRAVYADGSLSEPAAPVALYGNYRSSLMTFMGVKNLYLEGISVRNPAYHGVMFLDSSNIGVYGTRHTTFNANNGDGLEFGGSSNGVVTGNFFDTGDDVINFAAGQGKYGERGHSAEDVWMFGNYLRKGHGGVAIGSHTAAWVQHLLAEDNVMFRTETGGLRMKSTSNMAGGARDVIFRDTPMACLKTSAFIASLKYTQSSSGYVGAESADFRDIDVQNVSVDGNNNSTGCGMPDSNSKPVIDIQAGPHAGAEASTVGPFRYDGVRFRNVNPTKIEGLIDSTFKDVCFATVLDDQNPWSLDEYSTGNTFEDVTPEPDGGAPTGSCSP